MSSNFELCGSTIIYPKLNVLILTRDGRRIIFNLNFMKWYFLATLFVGALYAFKFVKKLPIEIKKFYYKLKPKEIKERKHAIVFGFGDSLPSILITKALLTKGYELILFNDKKEFDFRKKYNMNENENIKELDNLNYFVSYEEVADNGELIRQRLGTNKIEFIFDFTSYKVNIALDKVIQSNTNHQNNNNFHNTYDGSFNKPSANEKNLIDLSLIEEEKDIKYKTASDGFDKTKALANLFQNDSSNYFNSRIFYTKELTQHLLGFMNITELLLPFMENTKVLIFNYKDKNTEVNHKLLVDYKKKFFENLKSIRSKKEKFIMYAKTIEGLINYKHKQFTEQNAFNIICYSDIVNFKYNFI